MAHQSLDNNTDHIADEYTHYVRASHIGSYLYCKRSWWLEQVQGWQPDDVLPRRRQGVVAHQRHGCLVWLARMLRQLAWLATIALVLTALVMWLGWWPW